MRKLYLVALLGPALAACGSQHRVFGARQLERPSPPRLPGYTTPGASLRYGQAATVLYPGPGGGYKLRIRLLAPVHAQPSGSTSTTYLVRYRITNLGTKPLSLAKAEAAVPILQTRAESASFSGNFFGSGALCETSAPPRRFGRGVTWSSCDPYTTTAKLSGFIYQAAGTPYEFSPVRWH